MYRYDEFDAGFVAERVAQFRDQVERRLAGHLSEEQFRPLRLMNGVYLQLHAYMLRIAVPYGTLSSKQMRKLAHIARVYDKGYGHFTTRQNLQFNWPALADCPAILDELASVEMHAIQTSGNCIRNTTADQFAGAAADEIEDPRPYAEILRQWSSLHPEFSFLPRKFKIAVNGAAQDRAAIQVHDIGYQIVKNAAGDVGFAVYVGGGQGRTPLLAHRIRDFLPKADLLAYTNSILRIYNLEGRRDNKYKARIKILVHEKGASVIRDLVEADFAEHNDAGLTLPQSEIDRIIAYFALPDLAVRPRQSDRLEARRQSDPAFARFVAHNVSAHKVQGYGIITVSLKPVGGIPGDASADQMDLMADLAETYAQGELRVSHEQNIVLPHVALDDIPTVYDSLVAAGLGSGNVGLVTDIICCPGLDYCALATARSIPIAQRISDRFADDARAAEIGKLKIKISGCINACGHHHVGHIGILGLEKAGVETYQLTLGGTADETCSIGDITGRGFSSEGIVDAVETVVDTYLKLRADEAEDFLTAFRRVGMVPFKEALMPMLDVLKPEVVRAGDTVVAERLSAAFANRDTLDLLRAAITDLFPAKIALVSSFGAESVALLHLVAQVDTATPVVFVDTGHLFPETLAYRDRLIETLGLTNCRTFKPEAHDLAGQDPENFLWASDQDSCCHIRKVVPLARALEGYDAWISGRKRFQAGTRQALPLFEVEGARTKVNPLAAWSARDILDYCERWNLPRHDLVSKNFLSIGCMPCTSPVRPGEDARAGRWRGKGKVECGIHTAFPTAGTPV